MNNHPKLCDVVNSRLLSVAQHLHQREQHRVQLTSYAGTDYRPGAKAGAEMAQLLGRIQSKENLALAELVLLRDDVQKYCNATGRGGSDFAIADDFRAFQLAKRIVREYDKSTRYHMLICKGYERRSVHDVRFMIELEGRRFQVLELIHDLLQFWEMFIRYHPSLDLKELSAGVRAYLLGRFTDTVFHQGVMRRFVPVSQAGPRMPRSRCCRKRLDSALENIAFQIEERELQRPELNTYTGRDVVDASNKNAERAH